MAKNIQGMLGQYKKISISMPNISIASQNFTIKTNADFIVNNAYIFLKTKDMTQSPIGVDIKDLKNFKNIAIPSNLGYVTNVRMKASIQNKNEILLVIDGMDNTSWIIISKIVVTN